MALALAPLAASVTTGQKSDCGTRFHAGDYMVAVQWFERLPEDESGASIFDKSERSK